MPPRKRTPHRVAEIDLPRRAWSMAEVAAQLGVSYDLVLDLVADGQLGYVPTGREKRIPAEELDRFLADVKRGGAA
jgi:excisionase family DNA binding protein